MTEVQVLVVGAGPVGLFTALELASRGVRVMVVERNTTTTQHPKMDVTNGRSMEHFRRLGLAERIRDAGVARENPMDVVWVTRMSEWEVARFHYPNVYDARKRIAASNDGSLPLEPYMRMSQVVLEPVLRDELLRMPLADVRFGWALEGFAQDESGVTATIRNAKGTTEIVRCALLAGCDGGTSRTREVLGIPCSGQWNVVRFFMVHFRTPTRDLMRRFGIAWHFQSPVGGTLIAQDDDCTYTLHNVVAPGTDEGSIDPKALLFESLGIEFPCEILQANPWSSHLVVADSYGDGRVWLAGDSVHQFIPTGGYGMNTGICDAADLAWKFAATLQGWGGPNLLKSIETERRPIALNNSETAGRHMGVRLRIAQAYDPLIHQAGSEGDAARQHYGDLVRDLGNAENEALGIEIGYRYRGSPIIRHEAGEPKWDFLEYVPGTWPGVRAPHVFLNDGTAIFDHFGPWFSLLRFDDRDVSPFVSAVEARGVPLKVIDIRDANARQIYERDLVLIRPDQHVAWRGHTAPEDALAIIDHIRGA